MIYHITTGAAWEEAGARDKYSAPSLEREGFIHCSTRDQVRYVANNFFRGHADLCLLCIDESRLCSELRWEMPAHPYPLIAGEPVKGSLFPHLYGELNLDAVVAVHDLREDGSGFALPPGLS